MTRGVSEKKKRKKTIFKTNYAGNFGLNFRSLVVGSSLTPNLRVGHLRCEGVAERKCGSYRSGFYGCGGWQFFFEK